MDIYNIIINDTVYLTIAVLISLIVLFSIIKKYARLILFSIATFVLYLGYIWFNGSEIPGINAQQPKRFDNGVAVAAVHEPQVDGVFQTTNKYRGVTLFRGMFNVPRLGSLPRRTLVTARSSALPSTDAGRCHGRHALVFTWGTLVYAWGHSLLHTKGLALAFGVATIACSSSS